jgi:GTP pyrophosphokinase
LTEGVRGARVWLAHCCTPLSGDHILGALTHPGHFRIHRTDCGDLAHVRQDIDTSYKAVWKPTATAFQAVIQVDALDRRGLLADILQELVTARVRILSIAATTPAGHVAAIRISVETTDPDRFGDVLDVTRHVSGVFQVW